MLGKGNGDGQMIRDEILSILHKHHIKETNDHFYEQWHQKLHNNITPDDIDICQALLIYLKSGGNIRLFWESLDKAGITRERLSSFERKIVSEPFYNPNLIPDFEHFLQTLKSVHSCNDLITMFDQSKQNLGFEFQKVQDVINNLHHWDSLKQMGRITEARIGLNKLISATAKNSETDKLRDLLFLDLALETYMRQLVEKIIHINMDFALYIDEINLIIQNILTNFKDYVEFKHTANDWFNIVNPLKNILAGASDDTENRRLNILKIKSVADSLGRCLYHVIDCFNKFIDTKARYMGTEFHVDEFNVNLFTEEIIRGSIFFALSLMLKKLDPFLRKAAELGYWKVISPPTKKKYSLIGNFEYVKNLRDVQFKTFRENTILLCEYVGGNEEVPHNVESLIIINAHDYPDTLSHVSVRSRNLSVLFMVCLDEEVSNKIKMLVGKLGTMKFLSDENFSFAEAKADSHTPLAYPESTAIQENNEKNEGLAKELDSKTFFIR